MSAIDLAAARVLAKARGRAVRIRATRDVTDDPPHAFGVAFVKVVSEEAVQAVAYGRLDRPPAVVTLWNPLGRDASPLEPFAEALDSYLMAEVAARRTPRVWLPHGSALTVMELVGRRYERSRVATPTLQRLGWQCRALADESRYAGQQVVVVAADALRRHIATGQSPVEDGHPGALLAWVDPPVGSDPAVDADRAALTPASGILVVDDDQRVERLRKVAKGGGRAATVARSEIERILTAGAVAEWNLMLRTRAALLGLGLPVNPGLSTLSRDSLERIGWKLDAYRAAPSRSVALARMLGDHEAAVATTQDVLTRGDRWVAESERRAGRVVAFEVAGVDQPTRNRFPCRLILRTQQDVVRIRAGGLVRLISGNVTARVDAVRSTGGWTSVEATVSSGVKSIPRIGSVADWQTTSMVDLRHRKKPVWAALTVSAPAIIGSDPIVARPRHLGALDLADLLARIRGRS